MYELHEKFDSFRLLRSKQNPIELPNDYDKFTHDEL